MDSREFLAGTRRVRRFVPRGSVRELRVRGGLIRSLRARVGASMSGLPHVSARRRTTRCAPSPARSDLPALRPGARPLAQLGGPARRRRENDARFLASASRDVGFTTQSASRKAFCLPQVPPHRVPAFRAGDGRESTASCNVQNAPAKGRPRESPFMRAAFAELSALCLPTGVGARFSGKACLVFAGRRFCRMFGRFLFGAVLRVFGVACRAFGPQSAKPPFKP